MPSFGSPVEEQKKPFEDFRAYQDYKGEPLIIFSNINDPTDSDSKKSRNLNFDQRSKTETPQLF
jgi:hypothetical protein